MLTINAVAQTLGVSKRAVRLRVDALDGTLDAHVKRGRNNELLFNGEALAILQRLEVLRQTQGIPIRQAASRIRKEIVGDSATPQRQSTSPTASSPVDVMTSENDTLREEIIHLREEVRWLRSRVDELTPLALPKPHGILRWLWPIRARSVQGRTAGSR